MTQRTQRSLIAAVVLLSACPLDDAATDDPQTRGSSGTSGDMTPPPFTMLPPTIPGIDSSTSADPSTSTTGLGIDSSTSADPGTSSSTTDDPSTSSTTDDPSTSSSTDDDPSTSSTTDTTDDPGLEGFGDCNADPMACIPGEACFTNGDPVQVSFCGFQDCVDEDECPDAPPGGDALIACRDLNADMINECIIDCTGDRICPDGMVCFADAVCAWPADDPPPPPEQGFGDCASDPMACLENEGCIGNAEPTTNVVCTVLGCADVGECPAPPPGGDAPVVCSDITGDGVNDCNMNCSAGQTCPTGMECVGEFICAWPIDDPPPPPEPGFGDCVSDPMACLEGESCIADDDPPTIVLCTVLGCTDVSECPAPPPGGDAPVECSDITGDGISDCNISCDAGQTCPDGMECFGGLWCVWPVDDPPPPPEPGFGDCDADPTACLPDETCFVSAPPSFFSYCSLEGCADASDCPMMPPGGDAFVGCLDLDGDMVNECFIDCIGDRTCPDGMECFGGSSCVWPSDPPPPPMGEGFGDCNADPAACLEGETCLVDDIDMPTFGVCGITFCNVPADCPDPPAGGEAPVVCEQLLVDGNGDCFLDCSAGLACPPGMECAFDQLCMWPNP